MGQSHSRRSSTQNNGPTSSTSANGRVDGASAGQTTTDARKPTVPEERAATTSPRPRHVRSKSAATDKESNDWRKRLSSTFGKRRRSSKMGKEGMGSGFADVDELGAVAGAAEPAADVPEHDEVYSAAAERQEAAADGSAPQSPQPTAASPPLPSSRPRSTSAEAAPIMNDVVPEASTPEVPSGLSHDTAVQQEGAAPQASSPSAPDAFPDGAPPVATEPSSPSPPDAPDAAPAQTHAPPTGVLLVQGIVQTRDIRVDSGESSRSSDELPSSPEPEATPTDSSDRATSTDTAITGPEPAVASSPALDSASASGRRRLSTLLSSLRRRSSGYSSDRATRASASNERLAQSAAASRASLGSTTAADAPAQTEHLADAGTAPTSSGAQPATSIQPAPTAQPTTGTQPTAGTHRHGRADAPLPNHTIDVLSTYLSLAAAATAASLLTGSADPIVNSGLVGQGQGTAKAVLGPEIATQPRRAIREQPLQRPRLLSPHQLYLPAQRRPLHLFPLLLLLLRRWRPHLPRRALHWQDLFLLRQRRCLPSRGPLLRSRRRLRLLHHLYRRPLPALAGRPVADIRAIAHGRRMTGWV
ncbi:hypothetical protein BD626DRAFT_227584 [Schizophyllum amplum]|uniref:Uncharacterized protein n=1 Tax=Schizophyllum amplum TaxID=97359 RepID=A0A550BWJ4_9AGAR|nr:hypothetical protein BD626DRAFT_227584 [Auriculariopsis ampla]